MNLLNVRMRKEFTVNLARKFAAMIRAYGLWCATQCQQQLNAFNHGGRRSPTQDLCDYRLTTTIIQSSKQPKLFASLKCPLHEIDRPHLVDFLLDWHLAALRLRLYRPKRKPFGPTFEILPI